MRRSVRLNLIAIVVLAILVALIWSAVVREEPRLLRVSFLDVGQGDAIFIDVSGGRQVLIDGGAGTVVLRALSEHMPWYDRSIDLVVGTHADMDHIGGLIDLLPRYRVQSILLPQTEGTTDAWDAYMDAVEIEKRQGASVISAMRGQVIELGAGAYIEVLFPDRAVPYIETNTGCIVTRLVYGETAFMLTCDAPDDVENYLALLDGSRLRSDVLKAGHHGSKTSSSAFFVGTVDPEYAVYSRGCDNSYGHPHPDVVATFERFEIPTLDTCTDGTITFVSDGQTVTRE